MSLLWIKQTTSSVLCDIALSVSRSSFGVLLKHDTKSPLFRIGTPLPDVLYKMMILKRVKWKSITLDAVLKHNAKVLASGKKHTYYNFCKCADAFLKSEKNHLSDNLSAGTMMTIDRT